MEIRKLHKYSLAAPDKIANHYIENQILKNKNILIPRLFLKVLNILQSIKQDKMPCFYSDPYPIEIRLGSLSYKGDIIKKLNARNLKSVIYEVRINQYPHFYRILFVMENMVLQPYTLFTFGFIKNLDIDDVETNLYSVYSDDIYKKKDKLIKEVDYI
ncbi:hypothetical protein ACH434_23040 [Lysinibacillus fusiformis]|uniref:hypothetical protein n=1 Tax=Lysinibacillus fusiformis TaxID=28031 RepID=UPI0037A0CD98